jgi:insertion element IS1 protein InsB
MAPSEMMIAIHKVAAVEVDERWRFGGKKPPQRWRWHALDQRTGVVIAYVWGTHQDHVVIQ